MNVIVNATSFKVSPENRRELFQTILPLLGAIRREKGCLTFGCYVDLLDRNNTILIGEWETEAALDDHLKSQDWTILFGAINVLVTPADVDFRLLKCVAGIEKAPNGLMLIKLEQN